MGMKLRLDRLYECPSCAYKSCLLGVVAHALGKHHKNLLAAAHKHAPIHKHKGKNIKTAIRYVEALKPRMSYKKPRSS